MKLVFNPSSITQDITRDIISNAAADWEDSDGLYIEMHIKRLLGSVI